MVPYLADILMASDFQSFQAMESDTNVEDVRAMVQLLGPYGQVMLAHYKPDTASQTTFESDLHAMLTDAYLRELATAGFLRPFTQAEAAPFTQGVLRGALESATWRGQLVAAPFTASSQLLWYRRSVAARARLPIAARSDCPTIATTG